MFNLGPHDILVGLGSNSSDALSKLKMARQRLRQIPHFYLKKTSPIYRSDALLPEGAPSHWNIPYLNAALLIEVKNKKLDSFERAQELLTLFKKIENDLGRRPSERWAPRPIDLDLLDWGGPSINDKTLFIPHKEILKRPFVLLPAQDCASLKEFFPQANTWRFSHAKDVPFNTKKSNVVWPELMSIINLTPDSFSDGNSYPHGKILEEKIRLAINEGASIIDIGAESTRPGGVIISADDEFERLKPHLPLLTSLKKELSFKLSLDSRNPETAQKVMATVELDFLNDVQGFEHPSMMALARNSNCKLIFMHSLSIPPTPDLILSPNEDPTEQILRWGQNKIQMFEREGILKERLIIDPGIGFGKSTAQNYALLNSLFEFQKLPLSCLVGHSRKRFLDPHNNTPALERDLETAICSSKISLSGVDYLRVHSTSINLRALQLGNEL